MASSRSPVGDDVGVGMAAEPVVGLVEGDVRRVREATYAAVSPATPEPTTAIRCGVGVIEAVLGVEGEQGDDVVAGLGRFPPAGSTVIPAPLAVAASPLSTTSLSVRRGISPAEHHARRRAGARAA